MLSLAELDNKIALSRLDQHHRGVDTGFGVIKGVAHLPLYQRGSGISSNARVGIDGMMLPPNHKYDIKMARHNHKSVSNIDKFYLSSNPQLSLPHNNTQKGWENALSQFYGLPAEKDIVIENFAAEATGLSKSKTPARDFMINNLRADVDAEGQGFTDRGALGTFMQNPTVIGLIAGGGTMTKAKGVVGKDATKIQTRKSAPIVVAPAFDVGAGTATATATATATPTATATATTTIPPGADKIPTPGAPVAATDKITPPAPPQIHDEGDGGGDTEAKVEAGDEGKDAALKEESTKFFVKFSPYNKRQLLDAYLNIEEKLKLHPRDTNYISTVAPEIRGLLDAAKESNTESKRTKAVKPAKLRAALNRVKVILAKTTSKAMPFGTLPNVG